MKFRNCLDGYEFSGNSDKFSQVVYGVKCGVRAINRILIDYPGLQLYFLTNTLDNNNLNISNSDLDKFINFMRMRCKRANVFFKYIWVVEIQMKRYQTYDDIVPHWHIVILTIKGALPHCVEDKSAKYRKIKVIEEGSVFSAIELFNKWGYGRTFCEKVKDNTDLYNYLIKYLTKETLTREEEGGGLPLSGSSRKFGSSQFGYYGYPKWAYNAIKLWAGIFADVVILRKGSVLNIICLDSSGNKIQRVVVRSPIICIPDNSKFNIDYIKSGLLRIEKY